MKQFFGAFFGSVVGIVIATIIGALIIVAGITASFSDTFKKDEKGYKPKGKAVLELVFDSEIIDREKKDPFEELDLGDFGGEKGMGLNTILSNLEKSKEDTAIKGVFLNFKGFMEGK
ncbi:MAG: hypothetical protein JNM96_08685, partial [Bacteroidia bacterium]|nr:hypothetical protein [Bacteroidia bacterium]